MTYFGFSGSARTRTGQHRSFEGWCCAGTRDEALKLVCDECDLKMWTVTVVELVERDPTAQMLGADDVLELHTRRA